MVIIHKKINTMLKHSYLLTVYNTILLGLYEIYIVVKCMKGNLWVSGWI